MTAWFSCFPLGCSTNFKTTTTAVEKLSKTNVCFTGNSMSGGNKAIELQLQMRQNAEDMHSFMKELESWERDIKKKDEELRTGGVQVIQVCPCCWHASVSGSGNVLSQLRALAACCLCVVEHAPTCAQQRLQNKDEGKEEEGDNRQWRRKESWVLATLKDKSIWLSSVGHVWRGSYCFLINSTKH